MYDSCDSAGFREAMKCPSAQSWVSDGTNFMFGRDFIHAIHLRYGVLYSKARSTRGRPDLEKNCRRGCGVR